MEKLQFDTIAKIAQFSKNIVKKFQIDTTKKEQALNDLSKVFSRDVDGWEKVVYMNSFRKSFTRTLGKVNMEVLQILLCELDGEKYNGYNFDT